MGHLKDRIIEDMEQKEEPPMDAELLARLLRRAFDEGFQVSREGFNGECLFDHLGPDGLSLDELRKVTVDGILEDEGFGSSKETTR